jgi:hypothetical protein
MGPEIPQMPLPDSDEGRLDLESGRRDLSLKTILALVAFGIVFLVVMWVLDVL